MMAERDISTMAYLPVLPSPREVWGGGDRMLVHIRNLRKGSVTTYMYHAAGTLMNASTLGQGIVQRRTSIRRQIQVRLCSV